MGRVVWIGLDHFGNNIFETTLHETKMKEVKEAAVAMSPEGLLGQKTRHDQAVLRDLRNKATDSINRGLSLWVENRSYTDNLLRTITGLYARDDLNKDNCVIIYAKNMLGRGHTGGIDNTDWMAIKSTVEDFRNKGWRVESYAPPSHEVPLIYIFHIPETSHDG